MGKYYFNFIINNINFSETNLKVRQSLEEIQSIGDDIDELSNFDG